MNTPFVVEFAGPPKSGKTTLIDRVKNGLKSHSIIKEVSMDSPVPKRKILKYMEWSANELINKLIFFEEVARKQVVLIDCGVLSQITLLNSFKALGMIKKRDEEFYKLIKEHLEKNLRREDLIFYIKLDFRKELKRIKDYQFPEGFIINKRFLEVLNETYDETVEEVQAEFKKLRIYKINGAQSPVENSKIIREILRRELKSYKRLK